MSRALVIGGRGFIGGATCRALARRDLEVVVADATAAGGGEHRVDVTDAAAVVRLVERVVPDLIVHLAYLLGEDTASDPASSLAVNVVGTQNVFEAARRVGVGRTLYASSIAVYGDQADWGDRELRESDHGRPYLLYGWHKQLNEATAAHYTERFDTPCVGLRISSVYGVGRRAGGWRPVNDLVEGAVAGGPVRMALSGAADSDLIHVDDVGESFAALAVAPTLEHLIYNSGGSFATLGDVGREVGSLLADAEIVFPPEEARLRHVSLVDWTRLREELEVERPSLRDRLAQMIGELS